MTTTDYNPYDLPDDIGDLNPEEAYRAGVSAGWDHGYPRGVRAAIGVLEELTKALEEKHD